MRRLFLVLAVLIPITVILIATVYPPIWWSMVVFGPLILLGLVDTFQIRHAVLRNWPILGRFRYIFEAIRPEISQYFIESNTNGVPFNREQRSLVYQRAKKVRDTIPFGTLLDVYQEGYEWVNHSIAPIHLHPQDLRIMIGGPDCKQPYQASRFNIGAMSYGSLGKTAISALSQGAKIGRFAHNTGEGGISSYHLEGGGDLIWQIGTGYFGCRNPEGHFCPKTFEKSANHLQVKMIELKISQGAKPGHGGILPASKLTPEIAEIRGVPLGRDVLSPPAHSAFSSPLELLQFLQKLRDLSEGKPVGFKLCVGKRREFLAICKAMHQSEILPDFITVDGGEGGTGAAPREFSDHLGAPLLESLIFVHNALSGFSFRSKIRIIASGKVISGFDMVKRLALGADLCFSSRGMMMALGCIQARKCNSNHCPVGVATQAPKLMKGLVPSDKKVRVANFHQEMMESVCEIMGAMGIDHPDRLHPWHLMRRTKPNEIKHYGEIYEFLPDGALLQTPLPPTFARAFDAASAETFAHWNPKEN